MEYKVLKLYDVSEKLPEKSGEYLCYVASSDEWFITQYSAKHQIFNAFDHFPRALAKSREIPISKWAELPIM